MDSKSVGKTIQKNAKKVIAENGISFSRTGNKELSHLVTRLCSQPISSLESAQVLGERLGEKIVELTQSSNKTHLDKGVIRKLVVAKAIPSMSDLSIATASTDATGSKTKQSSKTAASVESLPITTPIQPVVLPEDAADPESGAPGTEAEVIEDAELTADLESEVSSAQVIAEMAVEDEEDDEDEDEDEEDDEEDEEDEDADEDEIAELIEEPEVIQAEDVTEAIATDTGDDTIVTEEPDAEEAATAIVSAP